MPSTWSAKLDLASGWTRRSASGTVTFGDATVPAAVNADRSSEVLAGGLVASGLVLALLVSFAYRRRARRREPVPQG